MQASEIDAPSPPAPGIPAFDTGPGVGGASADAAQLTEPEDA